MTKKKRNTIRCGVCGIKATKYVGNGVLPICNNLVCYHTRIEEVNTEIKILKSEEVEVS